MLVVAITVTESNILVEKLIKICRTTKVVQGGKKFRFSALVVVGDKNGKIGVGKGKARDTSSAIQKATRKAQKNIFCIKLSSFLTIPYYMKYKCGSSIIIMAPAKSGTGIIAGNTMRSVFEVIGIRNVYSKIFGSKRNVNNILFAMIECFKKFSIIRNKSEKEFLL